MKLRSTHGFTYYFAVGLVLITIFAFLEPSGTEAAGLLKGFFIWTIQIGLLLPILIGLHMALQAIGIFNDLNPWVKVTLSGLLGSAVFVPMGVAIDYSFGLEDGSGVLRPGDLRAVILDEAGGIVFPATFTWIVINAPRILRLNFDQTGTGSSNAVDSDQKTAEAGRATEFVSLIAGQIGTDLVYLRSELHYVRVVTTLGEKLVLFNMKDAIVDVETISTGIQTHRSYWVSGRHMVSLISENGRKYVLTTNGKKIPVARRRETEVKAFVRQKASDQPRKPGKRLHS